jgi:hypothetical protein
MTPRKAAMAAGEMFFNGKVCARHPELNGQRRAKSGGCPQCIADRTNRNRAKLGRDEYNRRQRDRRKALRESKRVAPKNRRRGDR